MSRVFAFFQSFAFWLPVPGDRTRPRSRAGSRAASTRPSSPGCSSWRRSSARAQARCRRRRAAPSASSSTSTRRCGCAKAMTSRTGRPEPGDARAGPGRKGARRFRRQGEGEPAGRPAARLRQRRLRALGARLDRGRRGPGEAPRAPADPGNAAASTSSKRYLDQLAAEVDIGPPGIDAEDDRIISEELAQALRAIQRRRARARAAHLRQRPGRRRICARGGGDPRHLLHGARARSP